MASAEERDDLPTSVEVAISKTQNA